MTYDELAFTLRKKSLHALSMISLIMLMEKSADWKIEEINKKLDEWKKEFPEVASNNKIVWWGDL